jgi:hypothetical protein
MHPADSQADYGSPHLGAEIDEAEVAEVEEEENKPHPMGPQQAGRRDPGGPQRARKKIVP